MASYENFYKGGGYGGGSYPEGAYNKKFNSGDFGVTTDPRTSNQLREVFSKLSTGAKVIEAEGLQPGEWESVPNEHLKEINRLKKLVGAEITLHGPLVEPTGIGKNGWDEGQRVEAQRQIWSAVERAHQLDPKGNIIVTFHASNGLPEPSQRVIDEKGNEIETAVAVMDERTGRFGMLPKVKKEYFTTQEKEADARSEINKINEDNWQKALDNLNISASRSRQAVNDALESREALKGNQPNLASVMTDLFKLSLENPIEYQQKLKNIKEEQGADGPFVVNRVQSIIDELSYAKNFSSGAYIDLKELFNQAYDAALKDKNNDVIDKLKAYRNEAAEVIAEYKNDPLKIKELSEEISKGIRLLSAIKAPQVFRPLEEFAVDKASETFGKTAFDAYKKFKDNAPIISIENPPAGMGISRAEEMKKLIEASRNKFVEKAKAEGISESEAWKQANKLIGATWDVGHINMLRRYGYEEEHLLEETKKIAPFVKHVHLSDNFGMEHTELPMGMGNVPIQKELEIIDKYNKQVKKIIETGGPWYRDFKISPFAKSLEFFGSPMYSGGLKPSWKQSGMMGGYGLGHGPVNPEVHHSYFQAGYTTLPGELGGQMAGQGNKSSFSGTPME